MPMTATALLVCAAPVAGTEEIVARLAPAVDVVVGVDGGATVLERSGVVPDLVVGDLDSVDDESLRTLERLAVPLEVYPADKDLTDIDLALDEMRRRGVGEVLVTAAFSGRLDHTLASVGSLMRAADLRPRVVEPTMSAWLLHEKYRDSVSLSGVAATVSVIAIGGEAEVSCDGVKWPLDHVTLAPLASLGVSNVVTSAARFTIHRGAALLVSEAVDYVQQAHETP